MGIPNSILSWHAQTSDLRQAVLTAFSTNILPQYALITYAFYAPHYMRTKLLDAAPSLSTGLPDQEEGFQRTFAGISSRRPQVVTWLLFLFALLVAVNAAAILGTGESTIVVNVGGSFSVVEFLGTIY